MLQPEEISLMERPGQDDLVILKSFGLGIRHNRKLPLAKFFIRYRYSVVHQSGLKKMQTNEIKHAAKRCIRRALFTDNIEHFLLIADSIGVLFSPPAISDSQYEV